MRYDPEELKSIVGKNTYAVWIRMLRELVPDSRTHRLAPLIEITFPVARSNREG